MSLEPTTYAERSLAERTSTPGSANDPYRELSEKQLGALDREIERTLSRPGVSKDRISDLVSARSQIGILSQVPQIARDLDAQFPGASYVDEWGVTTPADMRAGTGGAIDIAEDYIAGVRQDIDDYGVDRGQIADDRFNNIVTDSNATATNAVKAFKKKMQESFLGINSGKQRGANVMSLFGKSTPAEQIKQSTDPRRRLRSKARKNLGIDGPTDGILSSSVNW